MRWRRADKHGRSGDNVKFLELLPACYLAVHLRSSSYPDPRGVVVEEEESEGRIFDPSGMG